MVKVSIITPVFNGAGTIATNLESVFGQTEQNWEHIVVDDGSNDRTGEIVLSRQDTRLKYYREPKCGRSIARNIGMAHAMGEYLLFLDADDWLFPHALEEHTAFLDAHPQFNICVSDGYFCTTQGERIARLSERRGEIASGPVLEQLVVNPAVIGASNAAMIRRNLVKETGLRFEPGLDVGEDWLFWIQASMRSDFGFIPASTSAYRWHEHNTARRMDRETRCMQLWLGRKKIMDDPVFAELSSATREAFFYQLLTDLLHGKPEKQEEVLASPQFGQLESPARGVLYRLAASEYLLDGAHLDVALKWLGEARRVSSRDARNWLIEKAAVRSPQLAGFLIRWWRVLQFKPPKESLLACSPHRP